MNRAALLALALAACSGGTTTQSPAPAPKPIAPAIAKAAPPDAPPMVQRSPAAALVPPDPPPPQTPREQQDQAMRYADALTADEGGSDRRRPPTDLGVQLDAMVRADKRVTIADAEALEKSTLTIGDVEAKTATYMTGLRQCYDDALKRDPSLHGKVTVTFDVDETGRAVRVVVAGFDDGVSACFQARAKTWRFTVPKTAGGEATTTSFRLAFVLAPPT